MSAVLDFEVNRGTIEQELTVAYTPSGFWICMDDRKLDPTCEFTEPDQLYNQIAGSASGMGTDAAVMLETMKTNSFVNEGKPVYYMGSLITKVAGETIGSKFMNHGGCAAHLGAEAVAQTIIEKPELVHESAQLMKSDITEDDVEQSGAAYKRIVDNGLIIDPNISLKHFEEGKLPKYPAVPTAKLVDQPHNSVGFIIDNRIGKAFNVPSANSRSLAAYYSSVGNLEYLCKKVGNTLPLPYEKFVNQYIIRLAAIRANHLKDPQGAQLPIMVIDRTA